MEAPFDTDVVVPDESEQLDHLDRDDTLIDRGVEDPLDEGLIAPDRWSPAMGFGNTAEEAKQGETLELRMAQEVPEVVPDDSPWNPLKESREVGNKRAGRLVDAQAGYDGEDDEDEEVGLDVGFAGGAASAEEAAMHIIDPHDPDVEDDEE